MDFEKLKEIDSKIQEYEGQGFVFWNSYNSEKESEEAVRNLHKQIRLRS